MLVKQLKFRRIEDTGSYRWLAESEMNAPGFRRGFHAVGKTLRDVKDFALLVRLCERTGKLERLSEMHPMDFATRLQTTWGGEWYPHKRGFQRPLNYLADG